MLSVAAALALLATSSSALTTLTESGTAAPVADSVFISGNDLVWSATAYYTHTHPVPSATSSGTGTFAANFTMEIPTGASLSGVTYALSSWVTINTISADGFVPGQTPPSGATASSNSQFTNSNFDMAPLTESLTQTTTDVTASNVVKNEAVRFASTPNFNPEFKYHGEDFTTSCGIWTTTSPLVISDTEAFNATANVGGTVPGTTAGGAGSLSFGDLVGGNNGTLVVTAPDGSQGTATLK